MIEKRIDVNGEELVLDSSGALWWPRERMLVFADMHFEKGSFYAFSGQMLPPYDTRTTLRRVSAAFDFYKPALAMALGDSFHDRDAHNRLDEFERAQLADLGTRADWIWISGNHDPALPEWVPGRIADEVAIGNLVFRHEPSGYIGRGEIAGHLHPCKTVNRRGQSLRRRCFASDGLRLVMPSFGAYTGGLDVRDAALRSLFPRDFLAYVLGRARVYAVAA
ncbi:MAG: ligase-associated DNA damage response endonuclease PdeM [Proteobacteria bacterium]|nr:ligase-associated DNA damage response endonuclease PdeM [Pseudomonadota bacterium]